MPVRRATSLEVPRWIAMGEGESESPPPAAVVVTRACPEPEAGTGIAGAAVGGVPTGVRLMITAEAEAEGVGTALDTVEILVAAVVVASSAAIPTIALKPVSGRCWLGVRCRPT